MFKRDDYTETKHNASKWQGFVRSILLRQPLTETPELRTSLNRDLGPKILVGANDREEFRKGVCLGRYRSIAGLYDLGVAVTGHDHGPKVDSGDVSVANLSRAASIRSQLKPYGTRHDLLKKLGTNEFMSQRKPGLSQTILPLTLRKLDNKNENKKLMFEKEGEVSCDAAEERPQQISDIVDGSDSASGCGVLLEDGTACTVSPVKGRKRCIEHKGQRILQCPPQKHILSEAPTRRECEEAEDICGVILPDMVPCRRKPVSRRKRCEDHKGMRVNAFFFLFNPTEYIKISKPEICTGVNQEDLGPGPCCEGTTNNGLPCKRSAPKGSRRCWQHNGKTFDHSSSENLQSATTSQEMCGVKLYNGSPCENSPVKGRKRCEEHKGMRITA